MTVLCTECPEWPGCPSPGLTPKCGECVRTATIQTCHRFDQDWWLCPGCRDWYELTDDPEWPDDVPPLCGMCRKSKSLRDEYLTDAQEVADGNGSA